MSTDIKTSLLRELNFYYYFFKILFYTSIKVKHICRKKSVLAASVSIVMEPNIICHIKLYHELLKDASTTSSC